MIRMCLVKPDTSFLEKEDVLIRYQELYGVKQYLVKRPFNEFLVIQEFGYWRKVYSSQRVEDENNAVKIFDDEWENFIDQPGIEEHIERKKKESINKKLSEEIK